MNIDPGSDLLAPGPLRQLMLEGQRLSPTTEEELCRQQETDTARLPSNTLWDRLFHMIFCRNKK